MPHVCRPGGLSQTRHSFWFGIRNTLPTHSGNVFDQISTLPQSGGSHSRSQGQLLVDLLNTDLLEARRKDRTMACGRTCRHQLSLCSCQVASWCYRSLPIPDLSKLPSKLKVSVDASMRRLFLGTGSKSFSCTGCEVILNPIRGTSQKPCWAAHFTFYR